MSVVVCANCGSGRYPGLDMAKERYVSRCSDCPPEDRTKDDSGVLEAMRKQKLKYGHTL